MECFPHTHIHVAVVDGFALFDRVLLRGPARIERGRRGAGFGAGRRDTVAGGGSGATAAVRLLLRPEGGIVERVFTLRHCLRVIRYEFGIWREGKRRGQVRVLVLLLREISHANLINTH